VRNRLRKLEFLKCFLQYGAYDSAFDDIVGFLGEVAPYFASEISNLIPRHGVSDRP